MEQIKTEEEIINGIKKRLEGEFVQLFHEDGKPAGAGYCKSTMNVYKDIDALINDYHGLHTTTEEKKQLSDIRRAEQSVKEYEREKARFDKAKKIMFSEFKGDQFYSGDNYYHEIEDFLFYFDYPDDCSKYVWATKLVPYITKKDAYDDVYSNDIEDQLDPNIEWEVDGEEDLQKALDKFVEANEHNKAYWPDYEIALLIDDEIKKRKQIMEE